MQAGPRCWSPPVTGWMKINIDAATFPGEGSVGVSSVIRNELGEFVRARVKKIRVHVQPREAEALGLKEALAWAKSLGLKKCIFETDSKLLADACKGEQGRSYFHTIVLDCIQFFKHFDEMLVQFVHRSANEVAHTLARATHSMSDSQEWVDVAPGIIYDVLINDLIY
ncbi:uncharacterized protein LOC141674388 [Apium graveolens]|uniref:uncharacterized protein LOC141674388 n=1 Tax=Apium graveolens TaxID=4045 RepID=UPI003D7B0332